MECEDYTILKAFYSRQLYNVTKKGAVNLKTHSISTSVKYRKNIGFRLSVEFIHFNALSLLCIIFTLYHTFIR